MRNLLAEKSKYYKNFANSVYDQFRRIKYGIASCKGRNLDLDAIRKELVDYQAKDDADALTQVSITTMGWLPVYYPSTDESCDYQPPWCNNGYQIQSCNRGPSAVGMNYASSTGSTNLIEVNTGGCITRININPAITINNSGTSYTHTQTFLSTVWDITHNLGYTPNVWTVDENGNNISGTVTVINNNRLTITFSTSVKGTAYLS